MKRLTSTSLVVAIMGVFAAPMAYAAGPPTSAPVTVVNTTANPVPVQGSATISGSVSISGTPNVNVTNTPSVRVSNVPTVQVGNDGGNPVPVSVLNTTVVLPTKSLQVEFNLAAGEVKTVTLPTGMTVRLMTLGASDQVRVSLLSPGVTTVVGDDGSVVSLPDFEIRFQRLGDGAIVPFASPVPVTKVAVGCL